MQNTREPVGLIFNPKATGGGKPCDVCGRFREQSPLHKKKKIHKQGKIILETFNETHASRFECSTQDLEMIPCELYNYIKCQKNEMNKLIPCH